MGWIISVGRAGVKNRQPSGQVVSISLDVQGTPARIRIYHDGGNTASRTAGAVPARQAQRIWRNVLSTLADGE